MARLAARAIALLLLLGACSAREETPALTFERLPTVRLAVQSLEVTAQDQPPAAGGFIDRHRTQLLTTTAQDYLKAKLQAAGGAEWGKAVIEEASLVEQPRAKQGGITGALTREPAADLVGTLAVRVAIVDGFGVEQAFAKARVQMKRPVLVGTGVIERDAAARHLFNDLLAALGASLQASIQENLAGHLAA
jgi:hypothetical protein